MQDLWQDSYLSGENDSYLESMYESYLQNPETVPDSLREYFNHVAGNTVDISHSGVRNYFLELAKKGSRKVALNKKTATLNEIYQSLRKVYCGTLGFEYMGIMQLDEVSFIQDRV